MTGDPHTDSTVPEEADDAVLIRLYADRNDREALGLLFRRHSDFAFRVAMRVLRDPGEAEDAVQMAFVKIMQDAARYRGGEGVKVWMMKIVTNTCKNMIKRAVRRRRREETVAGEADGMTGNEPGVAGELEELVKAAMDQMPEKYRLSLWLHHYEGLPFQEVAQILSTQEATVRSHASRGLMDLRRKLARAGAAVPAMSIAGALGSVSAETAPVSLVHSLADIAAGVGKFAEISAMAQALGAGGKTLVMGVSLKVAVAVGLVAASTAMVGTVLTLNRSGEKTAAAATPALAVDVMSQDDFVVRREGAAKPAPAAWRRQWDFRSPELPAELEVDLGSWRHVPNGGPDGSGCMQIDTDVFSVTLNVPVERLPVIVTWREAVVYKAELKETWTSAATWKTYQNAVLLHGVNAMVAHARPARAGTVLPWERIVAYVGDGFMIQERDGLRSNFVLVERVGQTPIQVIFRGPYRIDDLSIRSARPEEMPDVRLYLRALEQIPPDKRKGTVVLPDLKPAPGQTQVTARFFAPKL